MQVVSECIAPAFPRQGALCWLSVLVSMLVLRAGESAGCQGWRQCGGAARVVGISRDPQLSTYPRQGVSQEALSETSEAEPRRAVVQ